MRDALKEIEEAGTLSHERDVRTLLGQTELKQQMIGVEQRTGGDG